jgi:hypothetical protein
MRYRPQTYEGSGNSHQRNGQAEFMISSDCNQYHQHNCRDRRDEERGCGDQIDRRHTLSPRRHGQRGRLNSIDDRPDRVKKRLGIESDPQQAREHRADNQPLARVQIV